MINTTNLLSHQASSCLLNALHRVNGYPGGGEISQLSEQDEAEDSPWVKLVAYFSSVTAGGRLMGKPAILGDQGTAGS